MRFVEKEHITIMSGRVVRWQLNGDPGRAEICASRDGVLIQGYWPVLSSAEDIAEVLRVLGEAQQTAFGMGAPMYPSAHDSRLLTPEERAVIAAAMGTEPEEVGNIPAAALRRVAHLIEPVMEVLRQHDPLRWTAIVIRSARAATREEESVQS